MQGNKTWIIWAFVALLLLSSSAGLASAGGGSGAEQCSGYNGGTGTGTLAYNPSSATQCTTLVDFQWSVTGTPPSSPPGSQAVQYLIASNGDYFPNLGSSPTLCPQDLQTFNALQVPSCTEVNDHGVLFITPPPYGSDCILSSSPPGGSDTSFTGIFTANTGSQFDICGITWFPANGKNTNPYVDCSWDTSYPIAASSTQCAVTGPPITTSFISGCNAYAFDWLPINIIIILIGLIAIAIAYNISKLLTDKARGALTGMMKTELAQLVISLVILAALVLVTNTACNISLSLGQSIMQNAAANGASALQCQAIVPEGGGGINPFTYSEYTACYLTYYVGPNLASWLYVTSYTYAFYGAIMQEISKVIGSVVAPLAGLSSSVTGVTINVDAGFDIGAMLTILSDLYLDALVPFVMIGIALSFVMYLALIAIQLGAFTLLLPIAIVMRALSFIGGELRNASNSVLALAIALYLVFPLTIVFSTYAYNWIYCGNSVTQLGIGNNFNILPMWSPTSGCNSQQQGYLDVILNNGGILQWQATGAGQGSAITIPGLGINVPFPSATQVLNLFVDALGYLGQGISTIVGGTLVVSNAWFAASDIANYLFAAVVLFAIDLSITIGFAMGLAKALNGGAEGAATFWSSI